MAGVASGRRANPFDYTETTAVDLCRIALSKDWKIELVATPRENERTLWLRHKRDARTKERTLELKPGKFVQMSLEMAEAFFGCFSIPILEKANRAEREDERKQLAERFAMTKAHAIVKWGDYPRPAIAAQGMTYAPLGPARFPDVVATIIPGEEPEDPKDPRWRAFSIRELYDLGPFVDCEHLIQPGNWVSRQATRDEDALTKKDFAEAIGNRDLILGMQGQIAALMAIVNGDPAMKARYESVASPAPKE